MRKRWVTAGAILVAIGLLGLKVPEFGKPSRTIEKTWPFQTGELRELYVQSDYRADVKFAVSENGSNSVHLQGQVADKMIEAVQRTNLSDGKLSLELRRPGWNFGFLDIGSGRAKQEIVVTLAKGTKLENLAIHMDSGSLTLEDAAADAVDITMDSGSVTLKRLSSGKLTLKSDSGSIEGSDIQADTTVKADSGSVKLERATGRMNLQADSGSIKLYKDDTADTEIHADSGSVYVHLPASFAGSFDLKSDSGSVNAPESKGETNDLVKVRADSGSIRVEQG
ncbi:DUF4097 family beta strand repeat-containing protein [Cohnella sp. CFH 77786]|uniref:DUF4097 family beta strand repeat-containing protein n=1 Tax=Cohnella sp. CFH 77786 TaxID=2662265 RepID=UPI001C61044A|nr:DUF4097 family beta strand repeat-containing protein [Cohnella sp. CFH 77786]